MTIANTFPSAMYKTYLPFVSHEETPVTCPIGAQVECSAASIQQWIVDGHPYLWPLRWAECEVSHGVYTFPSRATDNYRLLGGKQIIGTKTCPEWARLWPEWLCSPPKPEYYNAFADWLIKIIDTFHPWGIEIWNEPDCRPEDSAPENFGCWYDDASWYSSGLRYGQFTKAVYDYVKARRSEVKILSGALMNVNESETFEFLRGAIAGGLRGDYLSYHGYITERSGFDRIFTLAGKFGSILSMPKICTETSVLAHEDSEALRLLQRDYLQHIKDRLPSPTLEMVLWYTLAGNGWLNSDLQRGVEPTPAWTLFKEMA